jgi:hypothetical protein
MSRHTASVFGILLRTTVNIITAQKYAHDVISLARKEQCYDGRINSTAHADKYLLAYRHNADTIAL